MKLVCNFCHKEKDESEFSYVGRSKTKRWDRCKECVRRRWSIRDDKKLRKAIKLLLEERYILKKKVLELQEELSQIKASQENL